ncbi:MAG: ABC transporter permease [Ignavibacteria bacterium]|nr:ABC transporter permease [Ignavibacteria bacterium]
MRKCNKIGIIIKHEYKSKVRSKGFIISTLLMPIFMISIFLIPALIAVFSSESTEMKLAVLDKTSGIGREIVNADPSKYFLTDLTEDSLKAKVIAGTLDAYLLIDDAIINSGEAVIYTKGGGGLGFISSLQNNISGIILHHRLINAGADTNIIRISQEKVKISTQKLTSEGVKSDDSPILAGLGYILGLLIFMMMMIYGAYVMRGVIEEKANRIIEVIASSAKPFEIMMGKIIGIGAVGLTQVLFWVIIGSVLFFAANPIISSFFGPEQALIDTAAVSGQGQQLPTGFELPEIPVMLIIGFVFYFIAGYFIYSTLYAAIGSAVDQESDAAQLQNIVTLPVILPILFLGSVINNPEGTLAVILSLIPFFSPVLMIVRLAASEVPLWQVLTSFALMIATFVLCVWVASRIYRVGILMYGKKPKIKEIFKWIKISV